MDIHGLEIRAEMVRRRGISVSLHGLMKVVFRSYCWTRRCYSE
jgi:hypothetical protein